MDQHTVGALAVCGLFAGIFIVVPVVYALIRVQLKIATLVHRFQSGVGDAATQERLAILEQKGRGTRTRFARESNISARLGK